jgi:LPS export ABC transporter protein LptC
MRDRTASRAGVEERRRGTASRGDAAPRRLLLTLLLDAVLVSGCETGIRPTATIAATDSADQVLTNMSHSVTDAGIQRAHVRADTAYFFSPMQTAELRNVHITFYNPQGAETSTLTSREGTYRWRSGDMEARINVIVVRKDGATLRTEVLRYNQAQNQVSSDKPFVFDEASRHIEGEGFTSDPDFKVVTAIRPRGTGGKFTLPNQ